METTGSFVSILIRGGTVTFSHLGKKKILHVTQKT